MQAILDHAKWIDEMKMIQYEHLYGGLSKTVGWKGYAIYWYPKNQISRAQSSKSW